MRTFFIDLASRDGLLACVSADGVVASAWADHRVRDEELLPLVEKCWSDAEWKKEDIQRVACVTGPGGFMSLRVGVSLANTLAWGLHVPIAGMHLSDLSLARLKPEDTICGPDGKSCTFLWVHSTKKEEMFVRGFGAAAGVWLEPKHIKLEELIAAPHPNPLPWGEGGWWFGELIPEHREVIEKLGMREAVLRPSVEILPDFLSMQRYGTESVVPWYGRGW